MCEIGPGGGRTLQEHEDAEQGKDHDKQGWEAQAVVT